jgi:hypothetical protein
MPPIVLARLPAAALIASSQFVDEILQMRRLVGRVGAKNLPEALAHGIADRSAGLVIERLNGACG